MVDYLINQNPMAIYRGTCRRQCLPFHRKANTKLRNKVWVGTICFRKLAK